MSLRRSLKVLALAVFAGLVQPGLGAYPYLATCVPGSIVLNQQETKGSPGLYDTPSPVLRRAQIVDDAINMDQLRPNEATVRYDMTAVPVEEAVEKADDNLNYLFVFANKEYTPPLTT
ncbi:unnamed protein product [Polarella glacialis]|uniref:Uncharacterized protein n=1 Tax=Polarella glacialis TaxID=89957 RepID=A0A813DAU8_POLGL|nr:unnamed protein product [Polarella glacialis]